MIRGAVGGPWAIHHNHQWIAKSAGRICSEDFLVSNAGEVVSSRCGPVAERAAETCHLGSSYGSCCSCCGYRSNTYVDKYSCGQSIIAQACERKGESHVELKLVLAGGFCLAFSY